MREVKERVREDEGRIIGDIEIRGLIEKTEEVKEIEREIEDKREIQRRAEEKVTGPEREIVTLDKVRPNFY